MQVGYVSYLTLLSAEQTNRQAVINLVQAQSNRYADTAAFFQALGGGWCNRLGYAHELTPGRRSLPTARFGSGASDSTAKINAKLSRLLPKQ